MRASDPVRVAVIGTGFISDYHVAGIRAAGTGIVTTIVGRRADKTASRGAELGIPRFSTDHREAFADRDIDAIVIATPDATHMPLAVEGLRAGKSVMVQKPMAMSSDECRAIIAAARETGSLLTVSFMHRYFPEVRWLREQIAANAFGKVHGVRLRNATPGAGWADWFFDRSMVAGGVVMQLGVHGIDLVQHLFGPVRELVAMTATMNPHCWLQDGRVAVMPFEDTATAIYRMASGIQVSHEMSWTEVAGCDRFRLEVYFEDGTVWLRTDRGAALAKRRGDGTAAGWSVPAIEPEPLGKAHHAHWLDVVRKVAPPDDTAAAGLSTLTVAEHIYHAAGTGQKTTVAIQPPSR